ncbi:MAG: hypothetical protein KGS61_21995, partial [Verrucomicrobia bacterium]|nr:hypothetical protein [Verrucomicrobiota bacterium]
MNRLAKPMTVAAVAAACMLGAVQSQAQGFRNFDPAQMRQRMMDRMKEELEVTQDDEWQVLQPKIQKVMDARMAVGGGPRGMMFRGPRGGGNNAPGGDQPNPPPRPRFGPPPSPEEEALQKAIEAKATNAELKAALAKYQEYR